MPKQRKVIRSKRIYRKRSSPKKALGTVLFVLLLVALIGFGYIVMREWSKRFGGGAPESIPSSDVVSTSSGTENPGSEAASSEPDTALQSFAAKQMPVSEMTQTGSALAEYMQSLKSQGYNAVYVELKTDDGVVTYSTSNELARQVGAVSETPADLAAVVSSAKDAGLTPIARISALKDPLAAHVKYGNSYGYENSTEVNWLDDSPANGGKAWLNPYMENARSYIASLTKEAVDYGFSSVVLEHVTFPLKNTGKMGTIHETVSRDQILAQLVSECQAAAGTVPVYLEITPRMVAAYGISAVAGMSQYQALNLDTAQAEQYRAELTRLVNPNAVENYTVNEVFYDVLLGDVLVTSENVSRIAIMDSAVYEQSWKAMQAGAAAPVTLGYIVR